MEKGNYAAAIANYKRAGQVDGNNAAEGRRILDEAKISVVEQVGTMDGAAKRAAELASPGMASPGMASTAKEA